MSVQKIILEIHSDENAYNQMTSLLLPEIKKGTIKDYSIAPFPSEKKEENLPLNEYEFKEIGRLISEGNSSGLLSDEENRLTWNLKYSKWKD